MNTNQQNQGSNIHNAIEVLIESYNSVKKLFDTLHAQSKAHGYVPTNNKQYLSWLSQRETYGWLSRQFVKTFIKPGIENELYTVEINLQGILDKVPAIILGRHEYENKPDKIATYEDAANFNHRIWNMERFDITPENGALQFEEIFHSKTGQKAGDWGRNRGFKRAAFLKTPLVGLQAEEIKSKIFENLDKLTWPN